MVGAVLSLDFYWPNFLERDLFNSAHMCKPYIDGVCDAGLLKNDCSKYLLPGPIRPHIDSKNPRVVLEFIEAEIKALIDEGTT